MTDPAQHAGYREASDALTADMSGMSENSDLKNVGIVAVIIGGTVLLLGLIGVALTLS